MSASSQRSTSAGVVRMTGMALGWIGATIALASVVRKPKSSCSPSTGALFRAAHAAPGRPHAGESEEGPIFAQREPLRCLAGLRVGIFAK